MISDPRQFDMLAIMEPAPTAAAPRALPALKSSGDKRADDDALRAQLREAEEAAGDQIETIAWGSGAKRTSNDGYWFSMPFGKPGVIIKLWQVEPGRWITALSTQRINGGGLSGFWHGDKGHPTREAALLAVMRGQLRHCAHAQAMKDWGDGEYPREAAAADKLAAWAIGMCPPLVYGVDLSAEYKAMCASEIEKERRRRAMLRATQELSQRLNDAFNDIEGVQRCQMDGAIQDMTIPKAGDDGSPDIPAWHASFVGEACVSGTMPDGLEVVVYASRMRFGADRNTPPTAAAVLARVVDEVGRRMAPVPVRMATEAEEQLCHSDRRNVKW